MYWILMNEDFNDSWKCTTNRAINFKLRKYSVHVDADSHTFSILCL